MSLPAKLRYGFMKDYGAPWLLSLRDRRRAAMRKPRRANPLFGPPLKCSGRLKEIMTRHYLLARFASGAKPVAWVSSGAPVELLRALDFYTVYPENHGALCGAQRMGPEICAAAEERGYNQDLCSYARIDLGHAFSGRTPAGSLPRPDVLFCSNNICQTVMYWYKELAQMWGTPLVLFDTPFNFGEVSEGDVSYMKAQIKEIIPQLEKIAGREFSESRFQKVVDLSQESAGLWGRILETLKTRPAPATIFDAFVHLAPIVSLRGLPVALDYYAILLKELEERAAQGIAAVPGEKKRLMWDNIAIWYKIRDFAELFAARGCNFVAATYTNAWAETIHLLDRSKPWESMARAYSLVILNNNLRHRLRLMTAMAREYGVDGLVIHSARSCKPYSVGQYDIKRLMMDRLGLPSVVIEADITDFRNFSEEQARTRLEAFFEGLGV